MGGRGCGAGWRAGGGRRGPRGLRRGQGGRKGRGHIHRGRAARRCPRWVRGRPPDAPMSSGRTPPFPPAASRTPRGVNTATEWHRQRKSAREVEGGERGCARDRGGGVGLVEGAVVPWGLGYCRTLTSQKSRRRTREILHSWSGSRRRKSGPEAGGQALNRGLQRELIYLLGQTSCAQCLHY